MSSFEEVKTDGAYLQHYGIKRRSGRYPYGSGDNPNQHEDGSFLGKVEAMEKEGMSQKEIAEAFKMSTGQFRTRKSIEKSKRSEERWRTAKSMLEDGKSKTEIAIRLGMSESSVRDLLRKDESSFSKNKAKTTANLLMEEADKQRIIDVGDGVERYLGIPKTKLDKALTIAEDEGYNVYGFRVPQPTNPKQWTTMRVLAKGDIPESEVINTVKNKGELGSVVEFHSNDNGETYGTMKPPVSIDSKRIKINYADTGDGKEKDGVIEIRRGVEDLSLGNSHYAQVRIAVDGSHYLKGMAIYSDDIPKGYDIVFNTNKNSNVGKMDVLKEMKKNTDNVFGATIMPNGQSEYLGKDGKMHQSAINKVHDEGDWGEYSKKLPAQFLSKQSLRLMKNQLNLAYAESEEQFDTIKSYTNPAVRQALLEQFASNCDSDAVKLKAAALPRQQYQVILPLQDIKDTEVYAPQFRQGETVALVRFPHGGTFEIPILKVNNNNPEGERKFGNAQDAVGINHHVAERLSGADFDGDDVLVIPTTKSGPNKIASRDELPGLKGFEPKEKYATEKKIIDGEEVYVNRFGTRIRPLKATQNEMGKVSNLITDMTLKGAPDDEVARAVRHSMTIIDAEKHKLDWRQSEIDNGIAELKRRYQGRVDPETGKYTESAATLISRSKGEASKLKTKGSPLINLKGKSYYDPNLEEGALIWRYSNERKPGKIDRKTGEVLTWVPRTEKSTQMAEARDARSLSTGLPQEEAYADYANKMKSLANRARKEYAETPSLVYSPSAAKTYAPEVASLKEKLDTAKRAAPKGRMATVIANGRVNSIVEANPELQNNGKELKKIRKRAIDAARDEVGMTKAERNIYISDKEWEAIQAGAVHHTTVKDILKNSDMDRVKELALPRQTKEVSPYKKARIRALETSGYKSREIADIMGIPKSQVNYILREEH